MGALGDDIIRFSQGEFVRNEELLEMLGPAPTRRQSPPIIHRLAYRFQPSPFSGKYLTYQFDKSFDQRTWYTEHIFTNRQIHAIYHHYRSQGYEMINIGHRIFSLAKAADVINGSQGHVGVCSGMGWFSLACGKKPTIWYATRGGSHQVEQYSKWWQLNGAEVKYFDESFELVDCEVAADGKRYNHISR